MARIRTVKPEFFLHSGLGSLSPLHRLLFQGLWTQADRAGRLKDDHIRLKFVLLPYDNCDVDSMLSDLMNHEEAFITRYTVKGKKYIQINNFSVHQHPHIKEPESTIPAPCKHRASTMRAPVKPVGREGKGRELNTKELGMPKKNSAMPNAPEILTDEDFLLRLKNNPAYRGIDLDDELARMDAWLLTPKGRRRKKTRTFVVNWLNRCDKPIQEAKDEAHKCNNQNARTPAGGVRGDRSLYDSVAEQFDNDT